jgi:hypothetical protein
MNIKVEATDPHIVIGVEVVVEGVGVVAGVEMNVDRRNKIS